MKEFSRMLAAYFSDEQLAQLQAVRVGIAGAGGLGSNCAVHLVRSGVSNLVIADFDRVEESNLNRQFYFRNQVGELKVDALKTNLAGINPDVGIELYTDKLNESNILDIFADCAIVVEAFDRAEYKSLLVNLLVPAGKFIVCGSGLAGYGSSDSITVHRPSANLAVIGDLHSEVTPDCPPLAPRVAVAAAKQADTVLEYILNRSD